MARLLLALPYLLYAMVVLPPLLVVGTAFSDSVALVFPPNGFSLRWFGAVFVDREMMEGLRLSFAVAGVSAVCGAIIGTLAAVYLSRPESAGRNALTAFLLSPLSVPTVMTGFALLLALTQFGLVGMPGLIVAHIVITCPYIVRTVAANLAAADPSLPHAAAILGADPLRAFRYVTLPLARAGIVAGALFAFLVSFNHVTVSAFLSTPGQNTLPVVIFQRIDRLADPSVAAASSLIIVLTLVAMLVLDRWLGLFRSILR